MNKKEQAALDEANRRAKVNRALSWSQVTIDKDVDIPTSGYSVGWTAHSYGDKWSVSKGWSCLVSHGDGPPPKPGVYGGGSQEGVKMYSSRVRALRAIRCEMEERFARCLAEVDEQIAKEG